MVVFTLHADGHLVSGEPSVSNDSVESKRERDTLSLLGSDFKTQYTARCRVRFMSCHSFTSLTYNPNFVFVIFFVLSVVRTACTGFDDPINQKSKSRV